MNPLDSARFVRVSDGKTLSASQAKQLTGAPLTPEDERRIAAAQTKRERKAAKLERDGAWAKRIPF